VEDPERRGYPRLGLREGGGKKKNLRGEGRDGKKQENPKEKSRTKKVKGKIQKISAYSYGRACSSEREKTERG